MQSSHPEERFKALEDLIEDQAMKIIELEEEVAVLKSRKACTCGERVMKMSGSGSQEDPVTLEYPKDKGSNSGLSYHLPIMAQEELLHVIGSPVSQSPDVPEVSCACLVPTIIGLKDNVEMTAVPSENKEVIPVPPRYLVGSQHASRGCPAAYYCSSTCCTNHHAKQLGSHPYCSPPHFMGQDIQFPCTREFCTCVLASGGGADSGGSGDIEQSAWDQESFGVVANTGSPHRSPMFSTTSLCNRPCSPDCGGNCLGGPSGLC